MGDYFETIVDVEASAEQAPELAERLLDWFLAEGIVVRGAADGHFGESYPIGPNSGRAAPEEPWAHGGLELTTGRSVFHSHDEGPLEVSCPRCAETVTLWPKAGESSAEWDSIEKVISAWYEQGTGTWPCRGCARPLGLNEWRWRPAWGFGYLGFAFWNVPPLREEFVAEVSRRLGHRVVCPSGKL
ncbi:hypothetical protein [Sciscionella sediminilitoris]|uniref:hypothetical protein n=1 Tax=Sciscionella sediminilitoris TaxID=1445613 RepID=UPI0004DF2110|nr:hypothetical protein [Sciscionella sp. SE31]